MSYCNANLKRYYSNIDQYDTKKTLTYDWEVHSGNVDVYADSGSVTKLYRNGVDLGNAQASAVACVADGNWFYDSDSDSLYCYNTNDAIDYEFQVAPFDWADAKTNAITNGANWLESMLDGRFPRPLPRNADGTFDYILQQANGILACIILVRQTDPTAPIIESLMSQVLNDNNTGLLDLLNAGKIKLGFEITREGAFLSDGATDEETTGYIEGITGVPNTTYDKFKIEIVDGGTLATGTENVTVTYKVTDSQGVEVYSEEYIDGLFQPMGGGIYARFVAGVYVAGDYWFMTVSGLPSSTSTTSTIKVVRR